MPEDRWYKFEVTTWVQAQSDIDAHRLMHPALDSLRILDAIKRDPVVELVEDVEPHGFSHPPQVTTDVPPQYGVS